MDPTVALSVRGGVVVANNGLGVKVVLHGDEQEAEHQDEGGCLVVEAEERTVNNQPRLLEPLDNFAEKRQRIFDVRWSHSLSTWLSQCYLIIWNK